MKETPSAAEQMIRATYSSPTLIGEGSGSPLLDRARKMISEDFPNAKERAAKARNKTAIFPR